MSRDEADATDVVHRVVGGLAKSLNRMLAFSLGASHDVTGGLASLPFLVVRETKAERSVTPIAMPCS